MPSQQPKPFAESDPRFSESHDIETPEQMRVAFAVAGIGSRFLAMAIDFGIQIGIGVVIVVAVLALTWLLQVKWGTWILAGLIAGAFLLLYGYFLLFEIFMHGQTPGKRAIGIRVIKESGRPLSPIETIGRNLMRIVDQLPGFYAVGVTVALLNRQNKRLGDFVAGAIVIREASLRALRAGWEDREENRVAQPRVRAGSLTTEDVVLIEAFLQRRLELSEDVRYRMAREVLRRVEGKLEVVDGDLPGVEKVLEAAVYDWRSSGRSN